MIGTSQQRFSLEPSVPWSSNWPCPTNTNTKNNFRFHDSELKNSKKNTPMWPLKVRIPPWLADSSPLYKSSFPPLTKKYNKVIENDRKLFMIYFSLLRMSLKQNSFKTKASLILEKREEQILFYLFSWSGLAKIFNNFRQFLFRINFIFRLSFSLHPCGWCWNYT